MASSNKRKRHLRLLQDAKKQKRAILLADQELNETTDEDDFDIDGMLADPVLVQIRFEDLIKWNPAAESMLRAASTRDSRTTKYRKHTAKEQRHRSVDDCPKIHT